MIYRYVADLCRQEGLEFGNFNSDAHMQAIGLDTETDFYDRRHLNTSGVAKFVPYFADYTNTLPFLAAVVGAVFMFLCIKLKKKWPVLGDFSLSIAILAGVIVCCLVA